MDQQWTWRENQALARRLHAAKLQGRPAWKTSIIGRLAVLDKSVMRALARSRPGSAITKTFSCSGPPAWARASWLARWRKKLAAMVTRHSTLRAAALFRDLAIARADGSLRSLLARLSRIDVLVIDDWAMAPLAETERRDFWEICEDRYQARSTILTSQLPVSRWHEQIGDPTVADGILDRLVHNAHRIEMRGDSMRKKRGPQPSS